MKIIFGLGNPGKKYQGTRHNLGIWVVEHLFQECETDELGNKRLNGYKVELLEKLLSVPQFNKVAILVKSNVFMNQSGGLVRRLVNEYRATLGDILVIHDDLDIDSGRFRLQKGRRSAGHKGVESVISALGSSDFWRLRIGVGRPPIGIDAEEFVLERFTSVELETLDQTLPKMIESIRRFTNNPNVSE